MLVRSLDNSEDKVPAIWLATEGGSRRGDGRYYQGIHRNESNTTELPVLVVFIKSSVKAISRSMIYAQLSTVFHKWFF